MYLFIFLQHKHLSDEGDQATSSCVTCYGTACYEIFSKPPPLNHRHCRLPCIRYRTCNTASRFIFQTAYKINPSVASNAGNDSLYAFGVVTASDILRKFTNVSMVRVAGGYLVMVRRHVFSYVFRRFPGCPASCWG